MKKTIALTLVLAASMSLAACSKKDDAAADAGAMAAGNSVDAAANAAKSAVDAAADAAKK